MKYYIDFECWVVEASSGEEACQKAEARLATGVKPSICSSDVCEDDQVEYMGEDTPK